MRKDHFVRKQIVVMVMSDESNFSGVGRFLQCLLDGLSSLEKIRFCYIHLVQDKNQIFVKKIKHPHFVEVRIPLPLNMSEMIRQGYWNEAYNLSIYPYLKDLLEDGCILHLNTVNLIDLALFLKKIKRCSIVSHLHCLPWKANYNTNRQKFNMLYELQRSGKVEQKDISRFFQIRSEADFYFKSDRIVCVTECARKFLRDILRIPDSKIRVVYNGMRDKAGEVVHRSDTCPFQLVYVGTLSASKGLPFILEALKLVQSRGYRVKLKIAGKTTDRMRGYLQSKYSHLDLDFLGLVPFEVLADIYRTSDAGIIASLQEQCSYAAIEMMMFGLPVVSTEVDGLRELFTDKTNALLVPVKFSLLKGLGADIERMAKQIVYLMTHRLQTLCMGRNGRKQYENRYTEEVMMKNIMDVFCELDDNL